MTAVEPELVLIPGGAVVCGAPSYPADSTVQHRWSGPHTVDVPAFRIARHAVTRHEYAIFLDQTGHPKPADWDDPALRDSRQPVCGVSAEDADAYCRWLSDVTSRPYRLPHADECEKAARGGLAEKKFPWGDDPPDDRCCFGRAAKDGPLPVGLFSPNGYGLHDMVGNIWQWLADRYVDIAADKPLNTPTGKAPELNRVLVGGSFMTASADYLWVAYRHEDPPDLRHRCLGFRIAL